MVADPKKFRGISDNDDADDLRDQIDALKAQVQALVSAQSSGSGGMTPEQLKDILLQTAKVSAEAQERAINPSNRDHLHISAYSHPDGDLKVPRKLKCQMMWVGYDLNEDTTSYEEVQLLNAAEPGVYSFRRIDGVTTETLRVTGERSPDGSLSKLLFDFPVRENRDTLPSMSSMLRQAFKVKTPEQVEIERLKSEVEALRVKSETVAA